MANNQPQDSKLINKNGTIKKKFWEEIPVPPSFKGSFRNDFLDFEPENKPSWDDEIPYIDEHIDYDENEEPDPFEPDFSFELDEAQHV
jgi:hypothetical protein